MGLLANLIGLVRRVKAKRARPQRKQMFLESLEDRRVMAAYISGGYLYVVGSNAANDSAFVSDTTPQNFNGTLVCNLNDNISVFPEAAAPGGIKFYGYAGNDTFGTNYARPVTAYGGAGNDTINGGTAADTLYGGTGADQINGYGGSDTIYGEDNNDVLRGGGGDDHVYGQDGNDHIYGDAGNDVVSGNNDDDQVHGGDGNDDVYGGEGDDTLYGDANNDELFGYDGDDVMYGGTGNDSLQGQYGNDTLYGQDGDDFMTGQQNNDKLFGGNDDDEMYGYTGNDFLDGGNGHDMLSGWDGNDVLFGKEGNDDLYGGNGRDGLFGGNGADYVSGGANSDRYLTIGDESEIANPEQQDAVIKFGGPKAWTYGEILQVDGGLARLHNRTGNTTLLKDPQLSFNPADPDKPLMTIERDITDYKTDPDTGELVPYGNVGLNHENGRITLFDSLFNGSDNKVAQYVIHEIGHFWDQPAENFNLSGENVVDYFRSLSDWRLLGDGDVGDTMVVGGVTYVKAGNSNNTNDWWYAQGTPFVTDYATSSPYEDYADTFSAIVMGSDYHRNGNDTLDAPVAKRAWLNAWLNAL